MQKCHLIATQTEEPTWDLGVIHAGKQARPSTHLADTNTHTRTANVNSVRHLYQHGRWMC